MSGSDDFTLFLWNPVEDKKPLARLTGHQQPVNHLAFSPDGRRFASASFDKKVKVWDGRTGTFLATLNGHVGAVYQVAWSADSRLLVSASKDSTVKLWEMVALKRYAYRFKHSTCQTFGSYAGSGDDFHPAWTVLSDKCKPCDGRVVCTSRVLTNVRQNGAHGILLYLPVSQRATG